MFTEDQVISIMTYMIMLIVISIVAASLFLYLPKPAKHYQVICLRYFCGYFYVSSFSYVVFILSGAELIPLATATFLNNGLGIAAPYFLYAGLSWHNKKSQHLHQNLFIMGHIIGASTLITLISLYIENSSILVEVIFFPNFFIAFYTAYRGLLKNTKLVNTPGGMLFKRTFQFAFLSMVIMLAVIVISENFFLYVGGIMIMQSVMTIGFLSAVYFSYLYRIINRFKTFSITDSLTKLYNRRYFLSQANTIIRSAGRDKQPMSLIMCDLDHFKKVNDQYGHEAGDSALIAFANTLRETLREQDTIARIGGEEFIVLLPNTSIELVMGICERIRINTEALEIQAGDHTVKLTASFGICQIDTSSPIEASIRLADQTLYTAKSNGRNRVEHYNLTVNV